jgi:transcriptional regulator with XRE-family HTH domain
VVTAGSERDGESAIGRHLREIRRARGLTLAAVSQLTSVSISNLSKIENDQISPSFDIIKRICDGLDVSIEDFVRPGGQAIDAGRKSTTLAGDGAHFSSGQYDYRAHAADISRKAMIPLEMVVRARSLDEFDHWSRHRGEEFVFILSGAIEVHTEQHPPFQLAAGESAYFDSDMQHLFLSLSAEDARILSVSHDPGAHDERIARFMHPSAQPVEPAEEPTH